MFAREFSAQLRQRDIHSVLCFLGEPGADVRAYLSAPNVELRTFPEAMSHVAAAPAIRALAREFRPEVLLLEFTPFISTIPWAARTSGIPRVFFVDQGSQPEGSVDRRAKWWKRLVARVVTWPLTGVICISEFNLRSLRSRALIEPQRTVRVYNAADTTRAHASELGAAFRRRHRIPAEAIVVAQVSWMIPEKGIADLLDAMQRAIGRDQRLHLVLAGDGPCRAEYEERARQLGIADSVTWTGLVADPFGEGLFDAADIVCLLSRWEEAFGYVIAEAMAAERPVIGTRVGAIPELVVNEQTGLVIEKGDVDGAANAIVRLAADPGERRRMGAAGRDRAVSLFDVRKNVGQLLQVLGVS